MKEDRIEKACQLAGLSFLGIQTLNSKSFERDEGAYSYGRSALDYKR